ncbi:MAG: N-acetylmuramidase family protein [Clostridium sp.]|nr:N-acetylmuramidase family protein [Prevotella sp.]MCM1428535.1 N-acetylmuramidase family protein [Clostridium sp.]MCM1474983.1 N-acetylmuramidase family protein [Muribaculaceae bacterium]
MILRSLATAVVMAMVLTAAAGCGATENKRANRPVRVDSIPDADRDQRYLHLTDEDFRIVAEELGVEIAAIKAVVEIEAGKAMKGFWAPGVPVINFDRSMYSRYGSKGASGGRRDTVPAGLSGYALREWTQLINARRSNVDGANMGAFWGMFQIGGFNYKLCGCESVEEFVRLMSYSELEQLELFAAFIVNTGMLEDLKNKNWAGFARKYNGASYARRGYHTKMAAAYKKYSNQ